MRFGILGCRHGHIEIFIQEMLELGHVPVGIYEPEPKLAQVFSDKYSIPMLKTKEALYSCNPEVIGTSAINNQKIAVIEDCSSLGIHVMADKPVITSRLGLERLQKVINDSRIEVGMLLTGALCSTCIYVEQTDTAGRAWTIDQLYYHKASSAGGEHQGFLAFLPRGKRGDPGRPFNP